MERAVEWSGHPAQSGLTPTPVSWADQGAELLGQRPRIRRLWDKIRSDVDTYVGYPGNLPVDPWVVVPFLNYPLNNVGDPWDQGTMRLHSKALERRVLSWLSVAMGRHPRHSWGYVTSGGTEGNLYAMYLARELHPGATVYYSAASHYSVTKIMRLLQLDACEVAVDATGRMCPQALGRTLRPAKCAILFANLGTTMTGAIDDVGYLRQVMARGGVQQLFVHFDAALSGMMLPFIAQCRSIFAHFDSVAVSGHKFIGSPFPCGFVLTHRRAQQRLAAHVDYIAARDTTICGSRSALAPILMYDYIARWGRRGITTKVAACLRKTQDALALFRRYGIRCWVLPHSITLVFERPSEAVLRRWQIASEGEWSHLVLTEHQRLERVEALARDIVHPTQGSPNSCAMLPCHGT